MFSRFAFVVGLAATPLLWGAPAHPEMGDFHASLRKLTQGNSRYRSNHLLHPHQTGVFRARLVAGQHPFACVLSCADSRVPPEIVFDEGLGDLFVVRVAGNIVDDAVTGSLEYAVEHLGVPLVVVMGHTGCGAVKAALAGGEPDTHIQALVKAILPAVEQASHQPGDRELNTTRANVLLAVHELETAKPILSKLVHEGKIQILGAVYHLDTGAVELLAPPHKP